MAHAILHVRGEPRKTLAERRVEEERVVPETSRAARSLEKHAFDHTLDGSLEAATGMDNGEETPETRPALFGRHARHLGQHDLTALRITQAFPAVARRKHTWAAAQCVHLDPRV